MSVSSDLEKMYRRRGDKDLANAVLALLKDEEGRAILAMNLEHQWNDDSSRVSICEDISTLLKREEEVSSDLRMNSVSSSTYFQELKRLQKKHC